MQTRIVVLASLAAVAASLASGCKGVDCGDGTTERNGACVPASETVGTAKCGPFTELHGDTCVPMFPPTTCDPDSTQPDTDPGTGVTTCIGTGAGGCAAKLPCPTPASGDNKQIICGQIYDFETGQPFAQAGATGVQCTPGTTTGPCSLGIRAFDAVAFAMNPGGTAPLATDPVYIDDCGRFKVPGIAQPGGPFIALAIDDATAGPGGTTNAVGIATTKGAGVATKDVEAFVVRGAVAGAWGGPSLAAGIYAPVYRGHRTGFDLVSGVTFTFGPGGQPPPVPTMTDANRDFYFAPGATTRTTLDGAASATGANGTVLVSGATLTEAYSGRSTLPGGCMWDIHAGAAIPGVVFVQIFRPIAIPGMTCTL
jgi:hypothetical protein